jgi:hypothetical protein
VTTASRSKLKKKPSDTTIGADLVFLSSGLNWACKVRTRDGGRLLSDNPLRGSTRSDSSARFSI